MKHNNKNIYLIDTLAYSSKIKNWNPEFKIIFSLASLIISVASENVFLFVYIIISMALISILLGGINIIRYLKLMTIPLTFIILGTIAIVMGFSNDPYGEYCINLKLFYIYVTKAGLFKGGQTALKALSCVSSLYMMTLSTPLSEIVSAMRKIHIPKLIIELMYMIYRFIFIIAQVQHNIKIAAKSRLGYYCFKTSCYTFAASAASLLVISLKKANIYYDAMISRCYEGDLMFLECEKKINIKQIILGVIYFICIIMILYFVR